MKYLITGANGQLAKEFANYLEKNGQEYLAATREQLNVCNLNNVLEVIESFKPSVILNCAAYNYVDLAETDYVNAFKINGLALHNLSYACKNRIYS
jgi:dTDP-4-dehydrorhamnose reductase